MRGAGGFFCAGADLKNMMGGMKPPKAGEPDPLVAMNRGFGTMLRQVQAATQVVIVVCEGAALAGGMGLVCVSDIALAHAECKFGVPETARGLPPAQIAPFLVERIGLTQIRRLALTGAQLCMRPSRRQKSWKRCWAKRSSRCWAARPAPMP